jgi:hypothetical protein
MVAQLAKYKEKGPSASQIVWVASHKDGEDPG